MPQEKSLCRRRQITTSDAQQFLLGRQDCQGRHWHVAEVFNRHFYYLLLLCGCSSQTNQHVYGSRAPCNRAVSLVFSTVQTIPIPIYILYTILPRILSVHFLKMDLEPKVQPMFSIEYLAPAQLSECSLRVTCLCSRGTWSSDGPFPLLGIGRSLYISPTIHFMEYDIHGPLQDLV